MINIRVVADYDDVCGEAPIWDTATRTLYWSDCVGCKFYRFQEKANTHELVKTDLQINGAALDKNGGFVITNDAGIWRWDGGDSVRLVANTVGGSKCRMNDAIADPRGRLLAGSWFYTPDGDYELGTLISIDTDGSGQVLQEGFHLANGMAFSPDDHTLYVTDSVARRIFAYDYDPDTGAIRNVRTLIQVSDTEGIPDGLTVDAEGFLWSAHWYGSCVVRYDPDGKIERRIEIPAKQPSSVMFGGEDLNMLFVTSASKSEPMPVMPQGYDPNNGYFGGQLYCVTLDIQGKPEHRTDLGGDL